MNPEAAREAHKLLIESTPLYENVIDAAGGYDAKVDSSANCSLAAHLLNAVTVGVNTFVFSAIGQDEDFRDYEEDIRVLAAALALHDTNKYLQEARGTEIEGNTPEAFDHYFDPEDEEIEGDPFEIEEFVGEGYRDDLLYLVQRTETTEDTTSTHGVGSAFAGLARYCRIGDAVSSVALEAGVEGAYRKLAGILDEDRVHLLRFTQIEQPVLNDVLLGSVKEAIAGETEMDPHGVVIGSSPEGVLYLGESTDRSELHAAVAERVPDRVGREFEFSCKLGWNSFEYDVLAEVGIPVDEKEQAISDAFRDLLGRGPAGVEEFEYIPEEFDQYFPILAEVLYNEGRSEFGDQPVQEPYDRIREEQGVQKVRIHFIAYLIQHFDEHREFLKSLAEDVRPEIHEKLEPETDATGTVVQRFFEGQTGTDLGSKGEMCFLCGATATRRYSKSNVGLCQTYGYSRRVSPHEEYKTICEVCNLEHALLSHICEQSGVSPGNNVEVAYFYFDDFLGDVRVRRERAGNLVQGDSAEMDELDVRKGLVGPQYYIQPMYVQGDNHRMKVIRGVMQAAQDSGMKVVLGRPFTRFESADAVFTDEEATRPQELLGLDEVERFGPLPSFITDGRADSHLQRALHLFRIMKLVGDETELPNPYLELDRDEFHSIAHFAVSNLDNAPGRDTLRSYFESYHEQQLMDMKTVAERGLDLFGQHKYSSKYKKTKVFREAIRAFLSGKSQQMDEGDLLQHVESQVYAAAGREKYAGHATTEQVEAFAEAVRTYLVENGLYDLKKLSDWEDALVNSYYYAYEQALQDQ